MSALDVTGAVVWTVMAGAMAWAVRIGCKYDESAAIIYGGLFGFGALGGAAWCIARLCGAHA